MTHVSLLSLPWRCLAGALVATAVVTLPTCFIALFVLPPVPLPVMIRSFVVGTALPASVAWVIMRAFRGSADVRGDTLCLRHADLAVDVPLAAVGSARSWWLPLPKPGVTLRDRSGRRLPVGVACADPVAVLRLLQGNATDVSPALANPTAIAASTRRARGWLAPLVKFPLLGTIPALVLFYTHQHIAYGGTLGQYHLEGPVPYLRTLAQYWATTIILLVSYASCWRIAGEALIWAAAWAGPAWAGRVRRAVEAMCAIAYYGGVPAFLVARYLA